MKRRKENLFVCECGHCFFFFSFSELFAEFYAAVSTHCRLSFFIPSISLRKKIIKVKRKNLVGSADACQPAYETTTLVELHAAFPSP